jgi:hypothetical protein
VPVDPKTLPQDAETLKRMLVDVTAQLDRSERLLRQLLQTKTGRKSEQLSREQWALFMQEGVAAEAGLTLPESEAPDYDSDQRTAGKCIGSKQPQAARGQTEKRCALRSRPAAHRRRNP